MFKLENSDKSIFEYDIPPFVQAGAVLLTIVLILAGSWLFSTLGIVDTDAGTPWLIAVSMTFFFAIGNSVMSLAADDQNNYWWKSILSYVGLVVIGGSLAYLVSGVSMDDVGSYRWLYVLFSIGHIFFLAIVRTMRRVVKIAKEQDGRLRGEE